MASGASSYLEAFGAERGPTDHSPLSGLHTETAPKAGGLDSSREDGRADEGDGLENR